MFLLLQVQYRSKVSYQSCLVSLETRDESLVSRDESLVLRDESLVSRDESLVSRDSLKRQFWNKLQANCLARSRLQSCAKVMRTNFALFSLKYRRTFDRYFSPRQAKNRIEKLLLRIYIKSNEMSANFPTPDKHELTRQNVNSHFNRV